MSPLVQLVEVDGVPVVWRQGPEPLSAGLVLGVGRRDETFAHGGLTHLVEHLVMGSLPKSHLDRNASVGPGSTEFTATGRPEAVAAFLEQVCLALADLPVDRLAVEARVLAAEEERSGGDLVGLLLLTRYGGTGLGLSGLVDPALPSLGADLVREHARRWCVRENAVLWLTGPPPPGLRLPLPSGARPVRPPQRRVPLALPAQLRYPGSDPAVSFEGQVGHALTTAARVLADRLTDRLRHEGGHSYDVDWHGEPVDGGVGHVTVLTDAKEQEVGDVVTSLWSEVQRMAHDGPTQAELDHDLAGAREYFADPRSAVAGVQAAAERLLRGHEPERDEAILAELEALTPDAVAQALRPALTSALVLVPEVAPPVLPDVLELRDGAGEPVAGRAHKRRLRGDAPRGARLVVGDEGATLHLGDDSLTVRFDDCVAVGTASADHQHVELVGGHGLTLVLCAQDWKDGDAAVAQALARTTGVLRYPVRAEAVDR